MASIQTIELREEMFPSVINGEKVATLRKGRRDIQLGLTLLFGNSKLNVEYIYVIKVSYMKLIDITDEDAYLEGYQRREDLIEVMRNIYTDITDESIVTQIYFRYINRGV